MDRPEWMPETHVKKKELIVLMICICYHCIIRCSAPDATPEDKSLLPGLLMALEKYLAIG